MLVMHRLLFAIDLGEKSAWGIIRLVHSAADVTLVTSPQMKEEMEANGIPRVEVWRKGVDTEVSERVLSNTHSLAFVLCSC